MSANLHAILPPLRAQISQAGFANLHTRLPAVVVNMVSPPATPIKVYRLYREPIVTEMFAEQGSPATPGRYIWTRYGPMVGPVGFDRHRLDMKEVKIISGRDVSTTEIHIYGTDAGVTTYEVITILYENVTWEVRTWIPAQPAIPARDASTFITGKTGWDGGGRGRKPIPIGSRVIYRFTRNTAIQAGIARPGTRYSYNEAAFAWNLHGQALTCTASGRLVAMWPGSIGAQSARLWRFGIERRGGRINYLCAQGTRAPLTTFHSMPDPGGTMVPYGTPYTEGDLIDVLDVEHATLTGTLPAAQSFLSQAPSYTRMRARLPAIRAKLVPLERNDLALALPAVRARLSDTLWGTLNAQLAPLSSDLRSEPTFDINILSALMPSVVATFKGYTPIDASLNATLPAALSRLEDHQRGRIKATLGPLSSRLRDYGRESGIELLGVGFSHFLSIPLLLVVADGLVVGDSTDIVIIIDMQVQERLNLASVMGFGEALEILITEGMYVYDGGDLARREALQYAVNLATGAPSVYSGFDFQGFVNLDGIAYGWRADGLYRLGADRDCADTIRAMVDFGISDYDTAQRKRMTTAWLGIRTDGQTYLKVRADNGDDHVYRAITSPDNHKALLAKGVAGRRWSVTLELEDASFASLDSLELEIAVLARRFGGD